MPVTFDPSLLFSRTNMLRAISVILAIAGAWGGVSAVPKMASSAGAPINDVLNTVMPFAGAALAWLWSNWSKVKPSLIQAALAAFANPKDPGADFRLAVEVVGYFKSQWPDNAAIQNLDKFLVEFGPVVVQDMTKESKPG
jgi:hypothetical protein